MKALFVIGYVIYIIVTLVIFGLTMAKDLKSEEGITLFTLGYQAFAIGATIFMNYDISIIIGWWGIGGKTVTVLAAVAVMTWVIYGYYPACKRNPFWRRGF